MARTLAPALSQRGQGARGAVGISGVTRSARTLIVVGGLAGEDGGAVHVGELWRRGSRRCPA